MESAKNIFIDECKIQLHSIVREYVGSVEERSNARYATKSVKLGSRHVMEWDRIKRNSRRK